MPRTTVMFCRRAGGKHADRFTAFYPHPNLVRMHGPGPVLQVQVMEEPMTKDRDRHWGWWDLDVAEPRFAFVYPHQMLLDMCFPYGPEAEEKRGKGLRLPVKIEILNSDYKE